MFSNNTLIEKHAVVGERVSHKQSEWSLEQEYNRNGDTLENSILFIVFLWAEIVDTISKLSASYTRKQLSDEEDSKHCWEQPSARDISISKIYSMISRKDMQRVYAGSNVFQTDNLVEHKIGS